MIASNSAPASFFKSYAHSYTQCIDATSGFSREFGAPFGSVGPPNWGVWGAAATALPIVNLTIYPQAFSRLFVFKPFHITIDGLL